MTHLQTAPSNKNWLHTTITNLQELVSNLISNTVYSTPQLLVQTRSSDNQFITTREAKILAECVDRSSGTICVDAIGGSTVYFFVKRIVDLSIAAVLISLSLPVIMLLALWVAIDNAGSLISKEQQFTSRLIQKDGKSVWVVVPFIRYEFLTSRQTLSSQFLQATGLDALPSLFNVLRGEMSIIGSETLTWEEIEDFQDWQFLSLASKPGIIGLSRISGKLSWLANDRTRQEVWYACNQSFAVDAKIMAKTFQSIIAI